jgi:glucose-6-phosphate dehydrogenase assembly protein OpcA
MDPTQPFPLGPPQPVDPAAIERGLARLWEDASRAETNGGIVRSCTLNFAAVCASPDGAPAAADVVAAVTLRHPCRTLLLTALPDRPAGIEATVSVLCHLPTSGRQHICCEQITVVGKGDRVAGLPNLLLALLVPDLPLVVWWCDRPPLGTPLWERLTAIAERVVIDTATCGEPRHVADVAAVLERQPRPALADLAWNRLTRWRTLTAQFFDPPEHRAWLDRIDRVEIEVCGAAMAAEALLWLGWLASRLGWTPVSGRGDAQRALYEFRGNGLVQCEVHRYPAPAPYVLHRVALVASGSPGARLTLERFAANAVRAIVEMAGSVAQTRVVPMEVRDISTLLSDELDLVGHDQMYEEALAVAGRLAGFVAGQGP